MRGFSLSLLLAAAILAGCAGAPSSPDPEPATDPCLVTAPDDRRCLDDASGNGTVDERPHLHDYWGGRERLAVLEEEKQTGSTTVAEGNVSFTFHPGTDRVVPQGAAHVEVTAAWEGEPPTAIGPAHLWIKTAADADSWRFGEITPGTTVEVPSSNDENDLPHQRISGWAFTIVFEASAANPAYTSFSGRIEMQVEAVRGLEIPLYPGHPDLWEGSDAVALFDRPQELRASTGPIEVAGASVGQACFMGCFATLSPDDGVVVPFDTAWVEVRVTHDADTPVRAGLSYHGADSREFQRVEPVEEDATDRIYRIPVEANGDGPYAKQSLWAFRAFADDPMEDTAFVGSISITASAHRGDAVS